MSAARPAAILLLIGALPACSLAPAYKTPTSPPPVSTYQESGDWKLAQPVDDQPRGAWWRIYQDAQLDALEAKVSDANQNLKAAFARLQQARAATRIARADLFPTLTVGSSAVRARASENSPTFLKGAEPVYNDFDLQADLSYELDLFGRVRNSVNSAKASQQASAADLATLDLALHAELATDYFTLRSEDAERVLLEKTVEDYAKALQLTQNLYRGGGAALADVAQAQAILETARTQASDIVLQRAQTEHAIAVLIGVNPTGFHLEPNPLPLDAAPPAIDPGLPSALLERRPDVAAAERRVAAANAGIGVARAAYFPVFSLAAAAGFNSTQSSTWLNAPSRLWSVGPAAGLLTVFDAGRHRAESAQAHAVYDEQVADYRDAVLTAYQEVEDNLAALRQLEQESISEAAAVTATGKALQQAQYRYKAGLVTYLEVSTTETADLQAQLSNVSIRLRRMDASVLLIKALGGGWQQEELRQADVSTDSRHALKRGDPMSDSLGADGENTRPPMIYFPLAADPSVVESAVNLLHTGGAFADRGGNALDAAASNVAHRKDSRDTGLKELGLTRIGPYFGQQVIGPQIGRGAHKAFFVQCNTTCQPARARYRTGHEKDVTNGARLECAGRAPPGDALEFFAALEGGDLGIHV